MWSMREEDKLFGINNSCPTAESNARLLTPIFVQSNVHPSELAHSSSKCSLFTIKNLWVPAHNPPILITTYRINKFCSIGVICQIWEIPDVVLCKKLFSLFLSHYRTMMQFQEDWYLIFELFSLHKLFPHQLNNYLRSSSTGKKREKKKARPVK